MALVKNLQGNGFDTASVDPAVHSAPEITPRNQDNDAMKARRRARTLARKQQLAERIAVSVTELNTGTSEVSVAAEQLQASMSQISAGAEQASGAVQETNQVVRQVREGIQNQSDKTAEGAKRLKDMQGRVRNASDMVETMIESIRLSIRRQGRAVEAAELLAKRSDEIGEIVEAVIHIADQTNLLALNAAIEAASAGQHGRGFAVVADEVRALAENSQNSANKIQSVVEDIQAKVKTLVEETNRSAEASQKDMETADAVVAQLDTVRSSMDNMVSQGDRVANAVAESLKGVRLLSDESDSIAAAAEEQAASCEEAIRMVEQQNNALNQGRDSTQNLAILTEDLRVSSDTDKSGEEVAAATEDLAAAIEQMNRSSTEVATAVEQIYRGANQQGRSASNAASAVRQLEAGAQESADLVRGLIKAGDEGFGVVQENRKEVSTLAENIKEGVQEVRKARGLIDELEILIRQINKVMNNIDKVNIQTSMLAVNGGIEAARAGEHGKGFVVVATDIRNLSYDANENAERILSVIESAEDDIGKVRHIMDDISIAAAEDSDKHSSTVRDLGEVENSMEEVLAGNRLIIESSDQIAVSVSEASKGIQQIASAAEEASQATNEAATAAKQQAQSTAELAKATEEIASLADELQTIE